MITLQRKIEIAEEKLLFAESDNAQFIARTELAVLLDEQLNKEQEEFDIEYALIQAR